MHRRSVAILSLILVVLAGWSARLQAEQAPAGNDLPEAPAPIDPHSLTAAPAAGFDQFNIPAQKLEEFASQVDLTTVRTWSIFDGGRAKILDTYAREQLQRIYGKERWKDSRTGRTHDPVFTLLDLILAKPRYYQQPLIYVEVLELRQALLADLPQEQQQSYLHLGRLAPAMFNAPAAQDALAAADSDLRLLKGRNQVLTGLMALQQLGEKLDLISPAPGSHQWASITDLHDPAMAATGPVVAPAGPAVSSGHAAQQAIAQFQKLGQVWRSGDAQAVNQAIAQLNDLLPRINQASYPPAWQRQAERLYNVTAKFTIGYVAYFLGAVCLLIAFRTQRRWLVITGLSLVLLGFGVHSAGIVVRGVLAHRVWAIHNQYESFIAISWFTVLVGLILSWLRRQWVYAAAAALLGTTALMLANTVAIPSNEVAPVAGILATSQILYIHVNMVLASYGLIALGFFVSLFYLGLHYFQGRSSQLIAAGSLGNLEVGTAAEGTLAGPGGGASGAAESPAIPTRPGLLRDLDHAQMVVLQLAFWILGAGILMGAYWADHAWGRWWGWDPKETWALMTWIIYLMVIHLRFSVKNRGLVTAWMSAVGFGVMLWTYWGVNLLLAGLHSYA